MGCRSPLLGLEAAVSRGVGVAEEAVCVLLLRPLGHKIPVRGLEQRREADAMRQGPNLFGTIFVNHIHHTQRR